MNDRFIRLSISLARLQKVIQRIKASGMSRIELKAGHTLVLCRLAAASEGLHFSELTERCGLDPAMISRVLAELVRSGLVEKRAESGKYNALYLLTNAGHDRAARVLIVLIFTMNSAVYHQKAGLFCTRHSSNLRHIDILIVTRRNPPAIQP